MATKPSNESRGASFDRRAFLRGSAAAGLSAALTSAGPLAAAARAAVEDTPQIRQRSKLGRTGIEIPDVSFGTFALDGEVDTVRYALARGVTHFDTADGYQDGRAEETLGRALRDDRGRVTITTKTMAGADASADELMRGLDASLRRLQTDYVDVYLNQAVDEIDRLTNPAWADFVERARAAGKIRASGVSGHGPGLQSVIERALDLDWVDMFLVAYNYIQSPTFLDQARLFFESWSGQLDWVAIQPELPPLLARAHASGRGVMTMKTLRGAGHNAMGAYERQGGTFGQAAIRWVLSDVSVDGVVITMNDPARVDEYLVASGSRAPRPGDVAVLTHYEAANRETQCVAGCGDCLSSCPVEQPISEVLRLAMYERDYGAVDVAVAGYAELGAPASACLSCDGAPCASACPSGVRIPEQMREAHRRLDGRARRGRGTPG